MAAFVDTNCTPFSLASIFLVTRSPSSASNCTLNFALWKLTCCSSILLSSPAYDAFRIFLSVVSITPSVRESPKQSIFIRRDGISNICSVECVPSTLARLHSSTGAFCLDCLVTRNLGKWVASTHVRSSLLNLIKRDCMYLLYPQPIVYPRLTCLTQPLRQRDSLLEGAVPESNVQCNRYIPHESSNTGSQ